MPSRDPIDVKVMRDCHNPLLGVESSRRLEGASLKLPREVSLVDTTDHPLRVLAKECPVEQVVTTRGKFSLSVPSIHILQVQITYTLSPDGETLYFKRSYKFPVVAPLAVHHEVVQLDTRLLCNVTVTNTHPTANIAIFDAEVEPIPGFLSQPVGETRSTHVLAPKEANAAEYVFQLSPRGSSVDINYVRQLASYGVFKYQWRCPQLGSASDSLLGVQQQLDVRPLQQQDLDLRLQASSYDAAVSSNVSGLPEGVLAATVEKPFSIQVEVVNNSERDVAVAIHYDVDALGEVQIAGATEQTLGTIQAFSSLPFTLSLFPFAPGIFTLGSGMSLRDKETDAKYQASPFAQLVCLPA
ncbi:hypothetical protein FOZ60_002977 [Perkinsus olseni]|uniref:Trafficking protein particle complex subunit 13 C-terminal domain-containing protein n=1 Tax=Perkinsus olseni TaxID=32597 RepID=A0A7J6NWH5_PEROL|nr:hypothetical protein FOZ60_002977 [Perkinsus olseni]